MDPADAVFPKHPDRSPNRLARETSPYLLQHAYNPVDWYPWGSEAIERARAEDKPIFLSIGYSACHWCHVMERESFENPEIARLMNEHFVNIKVDREERPDLDQIYMSAVQAMTGHGGWPMSVFLTPDLQPFYGGTYYPPRDSRGMPGFPRVLESVHKAWMERRDEILQAAGAMTEALRAHASPAPSDGGGGFSGRDLDQAARHLLRAFDPLHGGFGSAPKFPHPMDLRVLLRHYRRTASEPAVHAVRHTLEKMARGGIYDHLGGGFARYSTDDRWLVPHFEKMLYDNALLSLVYLEAFQVTGSAEFAQVARGTLDYVVGRMTVEEGAFAATEDADSEGVEGKYYVWTRQEVMELLGEERGHRFCYVYDVMPEGNWEGRSILNLPRSIDQAARLMERDPAELAAELAEGRSKLLAARQQRVPPARDAKVLVAWNGLMIGSLAVGSRVLKEPGYLEAARRAAGFILERMRGSDGRLLHTFKDGQAKLTAYLDDYACLIDGLTRVFEVSGERRWIDAASELAELMIDEFADASGGGFFYTGKSHEQLIVRLKDLVDNATPSGNGMAATALLRLAALTGKSEYETAGRRALDLVQPLVAQSPSAVGQSLIAMDFALAERLEIAVAGGADEEEFRSVLEAVYTHFLPEAVVAPRPPGSGGQSLPELPLLRDRWPKGGRTTTYLCLRQTCREPILGLDGLSESLAAMAPAGPLATSAKR